MQDVRSEVGLLAEWRWTLLEKAQEAALVPPKHAKKVLEDTVAAARRAAEGAPTQEE